MCSSDLDARNIEALNIDAQNIVAQNIVARTIVARNIVQVHETKLKVKEKIKCRILIVYDDCKIDCPKIEVENLVKLRRV